MSSDTNEQQQQLQESFLQQQEKITALKELVRKSGAAQGSSKSAAKEKVKTIAERLLKSKAKSKLGVNTSGHAIETTSLTAIPFLGQEQQKILSISQGQQQLESPSPNFASTPNPTPDPTPTKPQLPSKSETLPSSIPYAIQSSGKIALMRQQLEQNKLRIAQKASSKQHLEQLVSQLKDKFETTQQCLEDTTELGRSMSDLSNIIQYTPVNRERHKSATDLSGQAFSLEKERIKFLENRCRLMEKQLEKEKQNNQRNTINISTNNINAQLEAKISELECMLQEKETEFQANETILKEELKKLQNSREITDFESSEENADLFQKNKNLQNQIEILNQQNLEMKQQIEMQNMRMEPKNYILSEMEELNKQLEVFKSKESIDSVELLNENNLLRQETETQLKRIKELNEINDVLETTRCDLTSKCTELEEQIKQLKDNLQSAEEKCSEQAKIDLISSTASDVFQDTDSQVKAEMAKQIQILTDELCAMREEYNEMKISLNEQTKLEVNDKSIAEKIASLEACIEAQRDDLLNSQELQKKYEEELMEKTIELNVLNANFKVLQEKLESSAKTKPLFSSSTSSKDDSRISELELENQQLKQKLDESNKTMIKLKLKTKQTEKQIEKLKKTSDLHAEVVKLTKEKEQLQQKITVLEDEKGQWQLTLMQSSQNSSKSDNTKRDLQNESEQKIQNLESLLKENDTELELLKQEKQSRVTSELEQIQLEEQVKDLTEEINILRKDNQFKDIKLHELNEELEKVNKQREELDKKLELYLNENIELLDKIEKLSKSSSSAESIEIVERLTQQEKREIEEFNKRLSDASEESPSQKEAVSELTQTEINPEITDSLNKLREESSELMNKIELFTTERREVLEKMEHLNAENQDLLQRIKELTKDKLDIEEKLGKQLENYEELQDRLSDVTKEKESLNNQMQEFKNQKTQLSQELTSLQQSSEVVAALDNGETLFEKCEKSLSKLYGELEAYRKANDKKSKFNISKKLAKEAENAHSQLSELLQKVKEASSAVETVTVVETVVAVTAPNGKALAEYEQLTAQNRELKATIQELRRLLDEARDQQEDQADNRFPSEEKQAIQSEEDSEVKNKLQESVKQNEQYETKLTELQSRVEDLSRELYEARTGLNEKTTEITQLSAELDNLRKLSEDFDRVINDKEMSHEQQVEKLTRLRKQIESKCDTYEQEIEILQTLANEQKRQLIEAYEEHENEMDAKLLEQQRLEEKVQQLKQDLISLKETSILQGSQLKEDLQQECDKLKESLRINKHLVQEQVEDLSNKQETIDTLNQQIIDLYKTMEENTNIIIEKEDEINFLQDIRDNNNQELSKLQRIHQDLIKQNQELVLLNKQQKEQLNQQLEQLSTHDLCQQKVHDLEQRNKEQLEKMKKYAANLKKKAQQCLDFESKLKVLEHQTQSNNNAEELQSLENRNVQLQDDLQKAHQQLHDKHKELEQIISVNHSLEEQVVQLQKVLNKKENEREALQQENLLQIQSMKNQLLLAEAEIKQKLNEIEDFRTSLSDMSAENRKLKEDLEISQNQVQKLNTELTNAQLVTQATADWDDFNKTDHLKEELQCTQENLELKTKEIEQLRQRLMAAQEQLTDWGNESSIKNADYENLNKVLQEKTAKLEKTENTLEELEKELMILREKDYENNQKLQELTLDLERVKTISHQNEENSDLQNQLKQLSESLKTKSLKFEKSKAVIKERNGQIQKLQSELNALQTKLTACPEEELLSPTTQHKLDASIQQPVRAELEALQDAYNKLNEKYNFEKANFEETITRLETLHDGIQAKLQEDMSYIETLEQENNTFKDKICRLQECVSVFEERRASMERRVNIMDEQMQTKTQEHNKVEDELIYRLNMLSEHDDIIAQRLIDSQSEREEIEENYNKLQTDFNTLQKQYQTLENDYEEFKVSSNNDYEQELLNLKEQLKKTETDMERQKAVYDGKLAAKVTELDELECELSEQLEKINAEKRQLYEQLERMTDDCAAHQNDVLRLQENVNTLEQAKSELERESSWLRMQNENSQKDLYELQELRMQSMQDKTEIENLRHQIETLSSNHESELQALRTQIAELDTLRMQVGQNQTDDQVFIETENKRLTDLLAEKETVIDNYQRQNLQLQMAAATAANTTASNYQDPFALAFAFPTPATNANNPLPVSSDTSNTEYERLNQELQNKQQQIYHLQQDLSNLQSELSMVKDANQDMQNQLRERQQDSVHLQTLQSVASALNERQVSDVIPAPPMFFTSDTSVRSPFDDLIQHSHSIEPQSQMSLEQPPTIEDLQRNVSDLEKHAQDLEQKLVLRNQREADNEEKFRDLEIRYQEREKQLQQSNNELHNMHNELVKLQQQLTEMRDQQLELQELQLKVVQMQSLLRDKDEEILRFKRDKQDEEHLKKTMPALESQIISTFADPNIQPTLDMFFGNSASAPEFEAFTLPQQSNEPVAEETIVPKKSYECQPKVKENALTALDLGEDWGDSWGISEATAEAEHYAKISAPVSLVPREQRLELEMQDLTERLQELELALERSEDQKKELHIKSGKLMKKLKEYKTKIDELQCANDNRKSSSVESNSMFGDLDAAIQEELKNQIKALEERLEEEKKNNDSFNIEKEKLLKRIDVLTAGNERITEMKERQDMDVQMYQARIRELQEKLTSLEDWGNEDNNQKTLEEVSKLPAVENAQQIAPNVTLDLQKQITALTLEVQDLTGDRLELQALLEEEKMNSNKAEATVSSLRLQVQNLEDAQSMEKSAETYQLNNLKLDMQNLKESYSVLLNTKDRLEIDLETKTETLMLSQANEIRLQGDVEALQQEVETLRDTLTNTKQSLLDLQAELSLLKTQKEKQIDAICCREKKESLDLMQLEFQLLLQQKLTIDEQANQLLKENEILKSNNTNQNYVKSLEEKLRSLTEINERLKLSSSTSNNEELPALLQEKESEILHLKQRINDLMNEDQIDTNRIQELETQIKTMQDEKKQKEGELQEIYKNLKSLHLEDKLRALNLELDTETIGITEIDSICCREKKESLDLMQQEFQLLLQQKLTIDEQAKQLLKENEILKSNHTNQNYVKSLEEKLRSLTEINERLKLSSSTSNNEELPALLQEKESEILHLKQRINDLMNEDQTEKLVLEILTKNQEIQMLKMNVKHLEEDKQELENNLSLQLTKEMQTNKDESCNIQQSTNRIQELETQIKTLQDEKKQMEEELQVLNNHVLESLQLEDKMRALTLELDTKTIEITELNRTLESFKSFGASNKTEASLDFVALNSQWEAVVEQRCGEIAKMWQEHLTQREQDFKANEERLKAEISLLRSNEAADINIKKTPQYISAETTSSSTPASDSPTTSASTSAIASQDTTPLRLRTENADSIIEKMQSALESQEMEIVTLKEQLAIRSAEYARIIAQYDPFQLNGTSSHSSIVAFSENRRQATETPMVSKSELDLAMYMLHQRDMKCEEMTLEIVNLLAERDTLQLKLSNTLRQLEAKNTQTGSPVEVTPLSGSSPFSQTENVINTSVAGSTVGIVAEDDLNQKLSQLQTVRHSKDKNIIEEREQRIRQIEKLQQDVAKMPQAAVSELVGSDLSQTNQSPSTALLNWLWGSKVNNTGDSQ